MLRWFFRLSTLLSLLLLLVTVAAWIRSCYVVEQLSASLRQQSFTAELYPHAFWILYVNRPDTTEYHRWEQKDKIIDQVLLAQIEASGEFHWNGLVFRHFIQASDNCTYIQIRIPFWSVTLLALILPAVRFWLSRRHQKLTADHCCPRCGYDLRATPDRCPECGTPADHKVQLDEKKPPFAGT